MVAYSPLRKYKNFFRLAFTLHPEAENRDIVSMIRAIEDCGEMVTLGMLDGPNWTVILFVIYFKFTHAYLIKNVNKEF